MAILNYLLISAYSGLLAFDMKMFKIIAILDRLVVYSKREPGVSLYF